MHALHAVREQAHNWPKRARAPTLHGLMLWRDLLYVCAGGALGSGARYLVSVGAVRWLGPALPWGTLAVNVAGSLAIGFVMHGALHGSVSPNARLFLASGVLGGFTTFSSFSYETLRLWQAGTPGLAALNVAANVALSLAGVALGVWLARGG